MSRFLRSAALVALLLVLAPGWGAARPNKVKNNQTGPLLKVDIRERQRGPVPNLNNQRWTLVLEVTNLADRPIDFNTNRILMVDTDGQQYNFALPRYGQPVHLEPKQTQKVSNVVFDLPLDAHPGKLMLRGKKGAPIIEANF